MIRLLSIVAVLFLVVGCFEGSQGPIGPVGPKGDTGDSSTVFKRVDFFKIMDVTGCRYDTVEKCWRIQSYYCATIKNIDSCVVQLLLRADSNHYWFEPVWMYGYTYRESWHILLKDELIKYSNYDAKLVLVGQ